MNRERAKKLSIWSIQQNPQQVSNAGAYEVIIKRRVETPVTWFDVYQQAALFTVRSTRIFGTQMEWNGRQSHDCSELFWLPRFSSWGSQNRTEQNRTEQNRTEQNRTEQNRTEQNTWGDGLCVSNAHCIECYFEGLTAIYILILCYLNAKVGQNQRVQTLQNHTLIYRVYKKKVIELQRAIIRESLGVWTVGFHFRKDQAFSYWMTCFSYQVEKK
jgi:hypothetical protein